jgi:hypothetical protein
MPWRGLTCSLCAVLALGAGPALEPPRRASTLALVSDAAPSAKDPAMRVHVVDYAAAGSEELAHAEREAERLWRGVGVALTWDIGEMPVDVEPSMSHRHPLDVTLVMLSADMAQRMIVSEHRGDGVLGRAVPEALRAYVFYDRVKTIGAQFDVRRGDVLGRVVAHELAHLMLGHTHSHSGLFRAEPDLGSAREAFDREDGAKIRAALVGRESH